MSKAETQKQDRCYAGRGGWQTCTTCDGRIHDADCSSPRTVKDCPGCMPKDRDAGRAVAECWTCPEDCTAQHVSREYVEAYEAMRKALRDLLFFCENMDPRDGWTVPWDAARNAMRLSAEAQNALKLSDKVNQ